MTNEPVITRAALLDTLKECVDEVFSTMVMSFKEHAVKPLQAVTPRDQEAIKFKDEGQADTVVAVDKQVVIGFDGDARGQVILRCSLDGASSIARGLLMMDENEALDTEMVHDALGECANMLAGSLKTRVLDPAGHFQLGLPTFQVPTFGAELDGALVYRVAQGVMSLEIWLD